MFWNIVLWILGIFLLLGLIRVLIYHPASFFDLMLEILFIDLLADLITAIFDSSGDGFDW